jgi:hypothetical protein
VAFASTKGTQVARRRIGLPGWPRFSRLNRPPGLWALALILAVCVVQTGCLSTSCCDAWRPTNVAVASLSPATQSVVSSFQGKDAKPDADSLRQAFVKDPTRELAFALAEFHYAQADQVGEKDEACIGAFYWASAYAYYHLFALQDGQPLHPRMWELYHSSLARLIMTARDKGRLDPKKGLLVPGPDGIEWVPISHQAGPWTADDFDQLLVVGDYDASEISRRYRREGLGVPLVAIRLRRNDGTPRDAFLAPEQAFGVTAVVRPDLDRLLGKSRVANAGQDSGPPRTDGLETRPATLSSFNDSAARLELIDPLRTVTAVVGGQTLPLAGDFSASFVAGEKCGQALRWDWLGFREPAQFDKLKLTGLFFLEPYQPGKIPVVFIHGLWSDFHTWDETLNELRMNPMVRERYQFAVYLYPTGSPFALNAMKLRKTLNDLRLLVPEPDPAMDDMVLVGHSMGGIIARLQVSASNNILWDMVSKRPIETLKADPVTYATLKDALYFDPNPSIRRVVFVATPQKGSNFGGSYLRRVVTSIVVQPGELQAAVKTLSEENPGAFQPGFLGGLPTSIDNLATDNPTLKAINRMPLSPQARFHSIIGHGKWLPLFQPGDGVVPTSSAFFAGVDSELFVNDWHTHVHRDLRSIREIERILHQHLDDMERDNRKDATR